MPGFARFNKVWATSGVAIAPTDAQANAGFAYLGPAPPTVETFNGINQDYDQKDNWLFNQLNRVIINGLGVTATDPDDTQLYRSIRNIIGGPFVRISGDVMTGALVSPSLSAYPSAQNVWGASELNLGANYLYRWVFNTASDSTGALGGVNNGAYKPLFNFGLVSNPYLTVYSGITSVGRIVGQQGVAYDSGGVFATYTDTTANAHILNHVAGWYDAWAISGGRRTWVGANIELMGLDNVGNFNVRGNATTGPRIAATGGGASIFIHVPSSRAFGIYDNGNTRLNFGQMDGAGNAVNEWGYIDDNGFVVHGNGHMDGSFTANLGCFVYNEQFGIWEAANATRRLSFTAPYYLEYQNLSGDLYYTTALGLQLVIQIGTGYIYNNRGPVGGTAPYFLVSDERTKENIEACGAGLQQILQLNPVSFRRKPPPGARVELPEGMVKHQPQPRPMEIGFIAQDVMKAIPEAVMSVVLDQEGDGTLEGKEPTLAVMDTPILAAVVSAIKQLESRITRGGL